MRFDAQDPCGAGRRGFQDRVWAVYAEARRAQAARFAASVVPTIREVQAAGHTSCNAIVELLACAHIKTHV